MARTVSANRITSGIRRWRCNDWCRPYNLVRNFSGKGTHFDNTDARNKLYTGNFHRKKLYTGNFHHCTYHGKGVLYFKNGKTQYDGNFKNGRVHGVTAEYRNDDGNSVFYSGNFEDGLYVGEGTIFQANGKSCRTTES